MATNMANLWSTPQDKQIRRRYHSIAKVNPQVFSLITPGLRLKLFSFETVMSEHDTMHLLPRIERVYLYGDHNYCKCSACRNLLYLHSVLVITKGLIVDFVPQK